MASGVVVTGVSLLPAEKYALDYLAKKQGRRNRSAYLASLIVKAAREEIGKDWERVVTEPVEEREAVPA